MSIQTASSLASALPASPDQSGLPGGAFNAATGSAYTPAAPDAPAPIARVDDGTDSGAALDYDVHPFHNGSVPPFLYYAATQIGQQAKVRNTRDDVMTAALNGQTPDEKVAQDRMDAAQAKALQIAQDTMHLDDHQFQQVVDDPDVSKIMGGLASDINQTPQVPAIQRPDGPSWAEAIATAGAAIADPRHAFDIGAAPFAAHAQIAKAQDDRNMQQFQVDQQARAGRIAYGREMLGLAVDGANARIGAQKAGMKEKFDAAQAEFEQAGKERLAMIQAKARLGVADQALLKQAWAKYYDGDGQLSRENARMQVYQISGIDPGPAAAITPRDQQREGMANKANASAQSITDLIPLRKAKMMQDIQVGKSRVKVNDATAAKVAEQTALLPEQSAVKVAHGWAMVDNLKDQISNRAFQQHLAKGKFDQSTIVAKSKMITDALTELRLQNDEHRKELEDLSKSGVIKQADDLQKMLSVYQPGSQQYTDTQSKLQQIQSSPEFSQSISHAKDIKDQMAANSSHWNDLYQSAQDIGTQLKGLPGGANIQGPKSDSGASGDERAKAQEAIDLVQSSSRLDDHRKNLAIQAIKDQYKARAKTPW